MNEEPEDTKIIHVGGLAANEEEKRIMDAMLSNLLGEKEATD